MTHDRRGSKNTSRVCHGLSIGEGLHGKRRPANDLLHLRVRQVGSGS